jgi:hypothetical protein
MWWFVAFACCLTCLLVKARRLQLPCNQPWLSPSPGSLNHSHCYQVATRLLPGLLVYMYDHDGHVAELLCSFRFIPALKAGGGNVVDIISSVLTFHPETGHLPWQRNQQPQQPLICAFCSR